MSSVDEDTKQEIINAYLKASPTPENSMEIVNDLASEYTLSPNSIRMFLSKAQVYVKKTAKASSGTSSKTASVDDKPARKSKQSSIDELSAAISSSGQDVNEEILSKLTGKAAEYFNTIIRNLAK